MGLSFKSDLSKETCLLLLLHESTMVYILRVDGEVRQFILSTGRRPSVR